jgi:maltose/moltooligosaccharide transporter
MLAIPSITDRALLFLPMIGVGLAWASIMGNPYVMLAGSIPPERVGVYMGIFNMFIVIPMMIQIFTLPLYYRSLLGGNPENVIRLAGGAAALRRGDGAVRAHGRGGADTDGHRRCARGGRGATL